MSRKPLSLVALAFWLLAGTNAAWAQPYEPGAKVRVQTAVYNPETMQFDEAVMEGTVVDHSEFTSSTYNVATDKVVEGTERVYIIDYGETRRLAREIHINSDVKPELPADSLHREIARQRGAMMVAKRSAKLDAEAVKQAHAIANLDDVAEGATLSVQAVSAALGIAPTRVGLIVSLGLPSAQTVVYGLGGNASTGWKDDRFAWSTLLNPDATAVGVGAAAIKRRAQNLEGPATGLVWVAIFVAPAEPPSTDTPMPPTPPVPVPPPPPAPMPLPVGDWVIRQYSGADDTQGKQVGRIVVAKTGEFVRTMGDEQQVGKLSVANGVITLEIEGGESEQRPLAVLADDDGQIVGYELSDDESPIEWLKPPPKTPGPIPAGEWEIRQYAGADDSQGRVIGRIVVAKTGEFKRQLGEEQQVGKLTVVNGIVTLEIDGGEPEQRPIVPLADDDGKIVGYELSDDESPIEWLKPRPKTPGPIPAGEWEIRQYAGADDSQGRVIGRIVVTQTGEFERQLGEEQQVGKLTVINGVVTLEIDGGESEQRPIVPLADDDGKIVGYELSDDESPIEWLKPRPKTPGPIPAGEWEIRQYAGADDSQGRVVGRIVVAKTGEFERQLGDEQQVGKLSVIDGVITLEIDGGESEQRPIAALKDDAGQIIGYELNDDESPIEWLKPRPKTPVLIPAGTWMIRYFESSDDSEGRIVGRIDIERTGEFQRLVGRKRQAGKLAIADSVITLEFEAGESEQYELGTLVDEAKKIVGYELRNEDRVIRWERPRMSPMPSPDEPMPPPPSPAPSPDVSRVPAALSGPFNIRRFEGPDDEEGKIVGTIRVLPNGTVNLQIEGEDPLTGKIRWGEQTVTLEFPDQEAFESSYSVAPNRIRIGNREESETYEEWERPRRRPAEGDVPNPAVPKPLPPPPPPPEKPDSARAPLPPTIARDWLIRRFDGVDDAEGAIVGSVKVAEDGTMVVKIEGEEPLTGKLSLRQGRFVLEFEGQEPVTHPVVVTPQRIKLGSREEDEFYEEWELVTQ